MLCPTLQEAVYALASTGAIKAKGVEKAALDLNRHAFFGSFQCKITRVSQTLNRF